jgi:curli biogenesis system outer membrane secretion channel CsgG
MFFEKDRFMKKPACLLLVFILFVVSGIAQNAPQEGAASVAMRDLIAQGAVDAGSTLAIADRLRSELFNTGAFTVLERSQMEAILKEQGFQQGGCTTDACAVEAGRLLGVKFFITGNIGKVGATFTINVRMIDVAAGKMVQIATSDCKCEIDDVLSRSTIDVASKLARSVNAKAPSSEETKPVVSETPASETPKPASGVLSVSSEPPVAEVLPPPIAAPSDTTKKHKSAADTGKKENIAVLDLEPRGGLSADEILSISDRLRGELLATGKYTVIERAQMDAILKEQGFQQTGVCSEASCIVQVGQLLAVHKMVGGAIGKVGKAYSINLKIIDVQTGKIERQVSDDIKCSKEELVSFHIRNVARKMAGLVRLKKPWYGEWYVWAPVGVLAVGGGAYLAVASQKPDVAAPRRDVVVEVPLQ